MQQLGDGRLGRVTKQLQSQAKLGNFLHGRSSYRGYAGAYKNDQHAGRGQAIPTNN